MKVYDTISVSNKNSLNPDPGCYYPGPRPDQDFVWQNLKKFTVEHFFNWNLLKSLKRMCTGAGSSNMKCITPAKIRDTDSQSSQLNQDPIRIQNTRYNSTLYLSILPSWRYVFIKCRYCVYMFTLSVIPSETSEKHFSQQDAILYLSHQVARVFLFILHVNLT